MKTNRVGLTKIIEHLDLLAALGSCVTLGLLIYLVPLKPLQLIIGFPFFFFIPGYSFLAALYPTDKEFSSAQRIFASLGMSVILIGLTGLAVTYLFGFTGDIAYLSTCLLILSFSVLAFYQRSKNYAIEKYSKSILSIHPPRLWDFQQGFLFYIESFAIFILIISFAVFILSASRFSPVFAEFYILGNDHKLSDYPVQVMKGTPFRATIGIVNHQKSLASYSLSYCLDASCDLLNMVTLENEEKWEQEIMIEPPPDLKPGSHKLSFELREDKNIKISHELHLWVQVEIE